ASSDDGNGLEHTTDRTESVREEGQSSRSRGPLRRRRPRGGIDDNCWKKAERTVGERREPGTQLAEPEVVPPKHDQRARVPEKAEHRREQGDAPLRIGGAAPRAAPRHYRQHPIQRDAGSEADEMD